MEAICMLSISAKFIRFFGTRSGFSYYTNIAPPFQKIRQVLRSSLLVAFWLPLRIRVRLSPGPEKRDYTKNLIKIHFSCFYWIENSYKLKPDNIKQLTQFYN